MAKYKSRYRIESTRLPSWDYAAPGYYFITICIRAFTPYFGQILEGEVRHSPLGQIAYEYWADIPDHFPNVNLDEFIIMPNHVHGIIILNEPPVKTPNQTKFDHAASLPRVKLPRPGSISTVVRSYKSAVTRWAKLNQFQQFAWQPRFYDHIIQDEHALQAIREYIQANPLRWEEDQYFSNNP